jgi:hypothetical protein
MALWTWHRAQNKLRRQSENFVGEVRGNLPRQLNLKNKERFGSDGAGRGI